MDMYVYAFVKGNEKQMYTPEFMNDQNKLWDAFYTQEHCFLTKVKIVKVAKIRILNPAVSGQVIDSKYDHIDRYGMKIPVLHPYNNPDYPEAKGAPDPHIKVIRIYNPAVPLIIKPLK